MTDRWIFIEKSTLWVEQARQSLGPDSFFFSCFLTGHRVRFILINTYFSQQSYRDVSGEARGDQQQC